MVRTSRVPSDVVFGFLVTENTSVPIFRYWTLRIAEIRNFEYQCRLWRLCTVDLRMSLMTFMHRTAHMSSPVHKRHKRHDPVVVANDSLFVGCRVFLLWFFLIDCYASRASLRKNRSVKSLQSKELRFFKLIFGACRLCRLYSGLLIWEVECKKNLRAIAENEREKS